jgi:hypothetical protein
MAMVRNKKTLILTSDGKLEEHLTIKGLNKQIENLKSEITEIKLELKRIKEK